MSADDAGLINTPEYAEARNRFIGNEVKRFDIDEANKPKKKGPKSDEEKAEDAYKRTLATQKEQIALAGQSTELAKAKYQITQGEFKTLNQSQKVELTRNAAALDALKVQEQFKSLQNELLTPGEALLQKTRERIKLLKQAAPATAEYQKVMEKISKDTVQQAPKFQGVDPSVGGASGELFKVKDAEKELKKWHKKQLEMQKELLDGKQIQEDTYAKRVAEINKSNSSNMEDIQRGYTTASLSMFSDLTSQAASMLQGMGQEGSAAYKALFFASKAAAIAQAIINTELAATKAMADGGLIMGIPAATAIRAVGYASVGLIAGQTLAGMAHDGIDRVPETGTWLLQRGERVTTASTSAKLDATLDSVSKAKESSSKEVGAYAPVTHISVTGDPDKNTIRAIEDAVARGEKRVYGKMTSEIVTPKGQFGKALHGSYARGRPK